MFLFLFLLIQAGTIHAQERRPIDAKHPVWMIHIDVWNNADPQKIINLIPEDIKPFVVMNLSMSCSYDKDIDMYKKPQSALQTYRSWASICCRNNLWFTCQPASGGHTHIQDDPAHFNEALEIHESFFKDYKNFLGWNYAEQFWGFDEPGDKSSSKQEDRLKLFAKLVPMHHQYGGFLTISFCGNIWSHGLNPMGMLKRNSDFLAACQAYPEAMLFLYKYTTSSCWYNNESVTLAPFICGLAKNYGIRYDNCGWNGAIEPVYGEGANHSYPGASGIPPTLEQMCLNGACVWDGPELIWTEDFKEINRTTVGGFTRRNWGTYSNFDNIWVDMFRKVLDGTIHIATREEVIARTKIAIINDTNTSSGSVSSNQLAYATPDNLYDNLYKVNDPFNKGNGYMMDNLCYFKSSGRYQAIPVMFEDKYCDELAKTIPLRVKRSNYSTKWTSTASKIVDFNRRYPEISKGNMFVARHLNELVCYTPFTYANSKTESNTTIPFQYNTCKELKMTFPRFSSAVVREYADRLDFYLNNFRSDTTTAKTDVINVIGAATKPTYTFQNRVSTNAEITENWNEADSIYTISVKHNGPLDLTINCAGVQTERSTEYLEAEAITEMPQQPEPYPTEIIVEAEDMDWKGEVNLIADAYNSGYRDMRGHSGMGFQRMKPSTTATLRDSTMINYPGLYTITVKYRTDKGGVFRIKANKTTTNVAFKKTEGEWKTVSMESELVKGKNIVQIPNSSGVEVFIDNVTFTPSEEILGIDEILSGETAEEGTLSIEEDSEFINAAGIKATTPYKGFNIVRTADGKTYPVFVP